MRPLSSWRNFDHPLFILLFHALANSVGGHSGTWTAPSGVMTPRHATVQNTLDRLEKRGIPALLRHCALSAGTRVVQRRPWTPCPRSGQGKTDQPGKSQGKGKDHRVTDADHAVLDEGHRPAL